jgi:hypothetical protein
VSCLQLLNNGGARHRLLAKFGRTIRNKKVNSKLGCYVMWTE